jgi:hypothetical protein
MHGAGGTSLKNGSAARSSTPPTLISTINWPGGITGHSLGPFGIHLAPVRLANLTPSRLKPASSIVVDQRMTARQEHKTSKALLDQQRVLAEFGEFALRAEDLDGILN